MLPAFLYLVELAVPFDVGASSVPLTATAINASGTIVFPAGLNDEVTPNLSCAKSKANA